MFLKLFSKGNREDQDEYVKRVQEMNRIVQSDLSAEDKERIIRNMNEDIESDYE